MAWRCVYCGLFVHLLTKEEKEDDPAYEGLQCEPTYECRHCNDIYFCTPLETRNEPEKSIRVVV